MSQVVILGGGHAASANAADLAARGFGVTVLEAPMFMDSLRAARDRGGFRIDRGDGEHEEVEVQVTDDPTVVQDAAAVISMVPAYAESWFVNLIASHLRSTVLVFACGTYGAAFSPNTEAMFGASGVRVLVTEALVLGGSRSGDTVRPSSRKKNVRAAALGEDGVDLRFQIGEMLATTFQRADSPESAVFGNLNWVLHPAITIANAGRFGSAFRYYADGVTPEVGRIVEHLDHERIAVGRAAGMDLSTCADTLRRWYDIPAQTDSPLWQLIRTNPAYQGFAAPLASEHRFLDEDIPFGLARVEERGATLGVATPTSTACITLCEAMRGRRLRAGHDAA